MTDRVLSGFLVIAASGLFYLALGYTPAFLNEPIGPRAYPLGVLALIIILSVCIFLSPRAAAKGEAGGQGLKLSLAAAVMLAYTLLFENMGYIAATILFTLAIGKVAGGRILPTLAAGTVMTVAVYLMFAKVLQVSLPFGIWLQG